MLSYPEGLLLINSQQIKSPERKSEKQLLYTLQIISRRENKLTINMDELSVELHEELRESLCNEMYQAGKRITVKLLLITELPLFDELTRKVINLNSPL